MNDNTPTADRQRPGSEAATNRSPEETLVADDRAALSPSEVVEQKLIGILNGTPLLISHVQRRIKPGPR